MLEHINSFNNVDNFTVFNSKLIVNSGLKIIDADSNSTMFEFSNSKKYRVDKFISWDDKLIFSDTIMGSHYCIEGNSIEAFPYTIVKVINNECAVVVDFINNYTILLNTKFQVIWKKKEIYHICTYCKETDSIAFLTKNDDGKYCIKLVNRVKGEFVWESSLHQYDNVHLIAAAQSKLHFLASNNWDDFSKRKYQDIISFNQYSGQLISRIDFNKTELPKFGGLIKYDDQRSRFIYPTFEIDYDENLYYRKYLLDSNNVPATIGHSQIGIWNRKYYIDGYIKDKSFDSNTNKITYYPFEILIFDRGSGDLVSKTVLDPNDNSIGVKKFKIDNNKLYVLDTNNNLRLYDFTNYVTP
jgi:hypothetical protein